MPGRLGIDLRHVPVGKPGAGVAHASARLAKEIPQAIKLEGPGNFLDVRRFVKDKNIDCLIVPSGAVSPFVPCQVFPWVHDLAIFEHPEWFPQPFLKRALTTKLFLHGLKRARHVFCVSETTKKQIIEHAGIPSEKISVARIGIDTRLDSRLRGNDINKPYGIAIGTIEPRKNYLFLIVLWEEYRKVSGLDIDLVILGKYGWGNVFLPEKPWLRIVKDADDEMRDRLTSGASILLQASLYEGFGMPLLEAMASNVPFVSSDRGSLPEIAGKAGIVLPLEDRDAWLDAIGRVLSDQSFSEELKVKGRQRVADFRWQQTAATMLAKISEYC